MDELKVSITYENTTCLEKLDKTKSLQEIIAKLCMARQLNSPELFGLKLVSSSGKNQSKSSHYINDLLHVSQGSQLELVPSVDVMVEEIFSNTYTHNANSTFHNLLRLCTDNVFVDTIILNGLHEKLQDLISMSTLTDYQLTVYLTTYLNLLKKNAYQSISYKVLKKVINVVKTTTISALDTVRLDEYRQAVFESALSVLCQILYIKQENFNEYKEMILYEIQIAHLLPFCSIKSCKLQIRLIMLVNAIVNSVKEGSRQDLIEQMNIRKNRKCIFDNIIKNEKEISKAMAHELYVYQLYILSRYKNAIVPSIDLNNENLKTFDDVEEQVPHRMSDILEFQEPMSKEKSRSTDTIISNHIERHSFITTSARESRCTSRSASNYSFGPTEEVLISYGTYDFLAHYKKCHPANYNQSHIEESIYCSDIKITAERVMQMLSKILQIGFPPSKNSENYHPLVFNTDITSDFFIELFCRTMWLLSKTRKEMKAQVAEDFGKVMKVLEKQVRMVLDRKPTDLRQLLDFMKKTPYKDVEDQWQKERIEEYNNTIENNPCIQELKVDFENDNKNFIFDQRMNVLKGGSYFPKLPEKKNKQQYFFAKLSDNLKQLFISDNDASPDSKRIYNITNIRHVIIGKNCPHVKDNTVKEEKTAFTLQLVGDENINFLAKDEKTAHYWIDGFHMLLGKNERTTTYGLEMKTLLDMDCALKLVELQGIHIPIKPPPIPPIPKPIVPPKGANLSSNKGLKWNH